MNIPSPEQEKKERSNKQAVPGQNLDELAAVETGRGSLLSGAKAGLVASSEKQAGGKRARGPAKRKNWKKPDVSAVDAALSVSLESCPPNAWRLIPFYTLFNCTGHAKTTT